MSTKGFGSIDSVGEAAFDERVSDVWATFSDSRFFWASIHGGTGYGKEVVTYWLHFVNRGTTVQDSGIPVVDSKCFTNRKKTFFLLFFCFYTIRKY